MTTSSREGYYEVYWPRAPKPNAKKAGARRLENLAGRKVAFVWDGMFQGDLMFEVIAEELGRTFPDIKFLHWKEFGNTHGAQERKVVQELPALLRNLDADAVISAVGA